MAIFDFLFGSSNPPPITTETEKMVPSYIAQPQADIIGEAMDVAKESYIPYTGPRLAGFTQAEQAAMQQGLGMAGIAGLQGQQAFTAATASGAPALTSVPSYMTDYQKQVADISADELRKQSQMEQQKIAAQAVGAGGLDSSRFAILEAERQKNLQSGLGDLYTKAQAQAYTTALKAAQQDRKQQLDSALGMGTAAAQAQQMGQSDVQQQLGIGALERGQQQQALDIAYTDFLKEQNYPKEQLGFVSDILTGQAQFAPYKTTDTRPADRPAPFFQQALGLAGQAAGIAGNLGWNPFK